MVDIEYCSSSFLMYRTIADRKRCFSDRITPTYFEMPAVFDQVHDSVELELYLKRHVEEACKGNKAALALSGGIDSAILAKFMPKGSVAYTFKCVVPGIDVTDETPMAAQYAKECGLKHRVVNIYWEDFERFAPLLMKRKGTPIHSIEIQIYKASLIAKEEGFETLIFGESSDANYGGLNGLLSKDWTIGEFVDRYAYVAPYHVLKKFQIITEPIIRFSKDGLVNVHEFIRNFFFVESMGSYKNACDLADIQFSAPYARTRMAIPLDLDLVRAGKNKYLVRELFNRLYPNYTIPPKTPMPRPMEQWLSSWDGPKRKEFWENCTLNMSGDQKWLVWCLERFLDMLDDEE